jgi:hypothetical protein
MTTPATTNNGGASQVFTVGLKEDKDGLKAGDEEQLSVKKVTRANAQGKTQKQREKEWKQAVMDRLRAHGKDDEIKYLNDHNWLGDQKGPDGKLLDPTGDGQPLDGNDAFADLWQKGTPEWQAAHPNAKSDAIYHGYTYGTDIHHPSDSYLAGAMVGNDASGHHIGANKKKGTPGESNLMDDASFQTVTSVQRKHADGTKQFANPLTDNYAVGARAGDLVKVTYPNGEVHYMPTDDTNPGSNFYNTAKQDNLGEVSTHALNGNPTDTQVSMQAVGRLHNWKDGGDYFTNDEWDEIGSNGYKNADGTIPNTRKELDAARENAKAKKDDAPPKDDAKPKKGGSSKKGADGGGGPKLLQGHPTALHGADARPIGYANTASVHAQGGSMLEGSSTAFVGPEAYPISRVGDGTTDDMVAVTGAEDFFVGGGTQTG